MNILSKGHKVSKTKVGEIETVLLGCTPISPALAQIEDGRAQSQHLRHQWIIQWKCLHV